MGKLYLELLFAAVCLFFGGCMHDTGVSKEENIMKTPAVSNESNNNKDQSSLEEKVETDVIVLRSNASYGLTANEKLSGYYADIIKKKFNIEIEFPLAMGSFNQYKNKDLHLFWGDVDYYEHVKNGELLNLNKYIKKNPKAWKKWNRILQNKIKMTYKNTGKRGIYGIPVSLGSYTDDVNDLRCLSIPKSSKHPDEAMKFLTYVSSEEGMLNDAYGPKGKMWKKQDGKYILIKGDWKLFPDKKVLKTKDGMRSYYDEMPNMVLPGDTMAKSLILSK